MENLLNTLNKYSIVARIVQIVFSILAFSLAAAVEDLPNIPAFQYMITAAVLAVVVALLHVIINVMRMTFMKNVDSSPPVSGPPLPTSADTQKAGHQPPSTYSGVATPIPGQQLLAIIPDTFVAIIDLILVLMLMGAFGAGAGIVTLEEELADSICEGRLLPDGKDSACATGRAAIAFTFFDIIAFLYTYTLVLLKPLSSMAADGSGAGGWSTETTSHVSRNTTSAATSRMASTHNVSNDVKPRAEEPVPTIPVVQESPEAETTKE